jgi:tetratricopeptide (TPR) repeat protein
MSEPSWITTAVPCLDGCAERGALLVFEEKCGAALVDLLAAAAAERDLEFCSIDAQVVGLRATGVLRAGVAAFLGDGGAATHPEAGELIRDALGEGAGSQAAWQRLRGRWAGQAEEGSSSGAAEGSPWLAESEVLARVLAGIGEVEPRLLLVRSADHMDESSSRVLQVLLAGSAAAGWTVALEGPLFSPSACERLVTAMTRVHSDERFDCARLLRLTGPAAGADDASALPKRGSSVELLDILAAAGLPLPCAVVGSEALSRYRGTSPRSGWVDFDGLLDCERAHSSEGMVFIAPASSATGDDAPRSQVEGADCRALRAAVEEVLGEADPLRTALMAALAARGEADDAWSAALEAGRAALLRGDALSASRYLDDSARRAAGRGGSQLSLLQSRARSAAGDPAGALRCAQEGIRLSGDGDPLAAALWSEAGGAEELLDQHGRAAESFAAAINLCDGDTPPRDAARARAGKARQLRVADDFVAAAAAHGEEARILEAAGLRSAAGHALARRAEAMAQAGATDQAIKELGRAAERLSGDQPPAAEVLEARMLMGRVFRFAGKGDQARQALALSADAAKLHAAADIEGQARLGLARLFLEGMPAQGAGRGEALRDGRAAAEAAIGIARGLGDCALEAAAEGILGELSYRCEDWDGALQSLTRQEELWQVAGRVGEQADVALRRSRVASRCDRLQDALEAADSALGLASRRRLHEVAAQAQLLRGENLQAQGKGSDALAAFSEAERLYSSLGPTFKNQASAASERARLSVG